jgi:hypothetical protein
MSGGASGTKTDAFLSMGPVCGDAGGVLLPNVNFFLPLLPLLFFFPPLPALPLFFF